MLNPAMQSADVHVVGLIRSFDKDKMALQCGDRSMQVEVAENARIEYHGII